MSNVSDLEHHFISMLEAHKAIHSLKAKDGALLREVRQQYSEGMISLTEFVEVCSKEGWHLESDKVAVYSQYFQLMDTLNIPIGDPMVEGFRNMFTISLV